MRLPFTFYRGGPTDLVVKYVAGKRRAEGMGRWFLVGPRTTIARVSTTDLPIPFAFTELTADGQQIVVQGELQIRLDAAHILDRRDFTIDPTTGEYESEDPDKVNEEATHTLQGYVRRVVRERSLKDMLNFAAELERTVMEAIRARSESFKDLGVSVVTLFVTAVTPANPDLKKALEAEAREKMLAAADKALADRRMDAATSDRALKEYEAETARTLEERRAELVTARNANLIAEAEADREATTKRLAPYRDMDSGVLLALGIKEIAASGKVGTFTVTPDLLSAVMGARDGTAARR